MTEAMLQRNQAIEAARVRLLLLVLIPVVAGLLVLLLLLPEPAQSVPLAEGERLLVLPAEQALLEAVEPGNLVQLHTARGAIGSARYVRVVSAGRDSLGLAMSEQQIQDYLAAAGAGPVAILPLQIADVEAALEQQRQWNDPAISLSLSATALELEVGGSATLTAEISVSPEGAVLPELHWVSSDPTVVTVSDDGSVKAVGAGTATLTAICGEVEASCEVTVLRCATGLLFGSEAYDLQPGETLALELLTSPEDVFEPISWASSDEAVATVSDEGVVTAHSGGSAVITAAGRYTDAIVTIRVSVPAESVVLNSTELSLTAGATAQLAAVVMPENVTDKTLVWSSDNEAVAVVDANGLVRAVAPGTATITVSCGEVEALCTVTVTPAPAPQP